MSKGVLVDTCIWIDFFRGSGSAPERVQEHVEKGVACTSGMILYELFQGVRSERERLILKDVFKGISYIEMIPQTWLNAAALSKKITAKGITLPPSDILIGQLAIDHNLSIMTADDHFKKIPGLQIAKK